MSDESTVVSPASEERELEELDAGSTRSSAYDLGDITAFRLPTPRMLEQAVGFDGDAVDCYRFERNRYGGAPGSGAGVKGESRDPSDAGAVGWRAGRDGMQGKALRPAWGR